MKRCNENPIIPFDPYVIPDDIYGVIYHDLSPEAKRAFSMVDKKRLEICSQLASAIWFMPPKDFSKTSDNIYRHLIARYPNIRKITFEAYFQVNGKKVFEKQIHALIDFLNKNKDKHPLSHIKQMDIREIGCDNQAFLGPLSHPRLESVIWRTLHGSSALHGKDIQPILDINLSFANQP